MTRESAPIIALMTIERITVLYDDPAEAIETIRKTAAEALDTAGYSDRP